MTELSNLPTFDVIVVGGGAAGLATAIFAKRRAPGLSVAVLDGARKIGAKILVSGGGRCNVTNIRVGPEDFWGGSRNTIRRVLSAFSAERTAEFFHELGVALHEEERGKLFPDSHDAHTVLDALIAEADRLGVRILAGHRVTEIRSDGATKVRAPKEEARTSDEGSRTAIPMQSGERVAGPGGFVVEMSQGAFVSRHVVLATGGLSLPKTGSDGGGYALAQRLGHSLVPTTPGLAPFVLDGEFHTPLSGVSQDVEITVAVDGAKPVRIAGAMLWTHFGVSGPAVLDASRHWERARLEQCQVLVTVSFLPGSDFALAERKILDLAATHPKAKLQNVLSLLVPARAAVALLRHESIDGGTAMAHLPKESRRELCHALTAFPLPVRATRGYNYAEVTAGGVPLSEIEPATMESRRCSGLYLVGEILDVDGRIGGFNFQWGWSSGFVAGAALARSAGARAANDGG